MAWAALDPQAGHIRFAVSLRFHLTNGTLSETRRKIGFEIRELVLLAGPIVGMQVGQISNGFIDVVMVGRLGPEALASVALGNATFLFFLLVCVGVLTAVGPLVSQAFGAGTYDPIGRSVRQGLWLAAALALPIGLLLWSIGPVWILMHQDPHTVAIAQEYIRAVVWGFVPFLWFIVFRNFVEAVSRPWPVTAIIVCSIGLNIVANAALMFGHFGMPALGVVGTGWATAIVYWFQFVALVGYVLSRPRFRAFRLFHRLARIDLQYLREILHIGLPIGGIYGLEVAFFASTAFLAGTLGHTTLAAHQLAIQCAAFTFMIPLGIGIATSVRVGHAVGRQDLIGARWAGQLGIGLSVLVMTMAAVVFWIAPRPIVSLFLDLGEAANTETAMLAVKLLGIAAVFQIFDGMQVSASGALRGMKDTRIPMMLCFIAYWVVGLPASAALGYAAGWGVQGFWAGLVLGLAVAAVLLCVRFLRLARRPPLAAVS